MEIEWYDSRLRRGHRHASPVVTIGKHAIFFSAAMQPLIGNHERLDIGIATAQHQTHIGFRFHENGRFTLDKTRGTWRAAIPASLALRARRAPVHQNNGILSITIPSPVQAPKNSRAKRRPPASPPTQDRLEDQPKLQGRENRSRVTPKSGSTISSMREHPREHDKLRTARA